MYCGEEEAIFTLANRCQPQKDGMSFHVKSLFDFDQKKINSGIIKGQVCASNIVPE